MEGAIPNPTTPLAFLPPTIANQLEASRYLYAVTAGVRHLCICRVNPLDLIFKGMDVGCVNVNPGGIPNIHTS